MKNRSGLLDISTPQKARLRSIPKTHRSSYLDLYMLEMDREKVEKELALLEKRKESNERRLGEIERQIKLLESSQKESPDAAEPKNEKKRWTTMKMPY